MPKRYEELLCLDEATPMKLKKQEATGKITANKGVQADLCGHMMLRDLKQSEREANLKIKLKIKQEKLDD